MRCSLPALLLASLAAAGCGDKGGSVPGDLGAGDTATGGGATADSGRTEGGGATLVVATAPEVVDPDGDGHAPDWQGGDDCDDSDPLVWSGYPF